MCRVIRPNVVLVMITAKNKKRSLVNRVQNASDSTDFDENGTSLRLN